MPYLNNEALREQVIKKSIECEKEVLEQKLNPSMDKMNQKESKIKKIKV